MTTKNENQETETRLLSSKEQAILSQIAAKEAPHSQRAQALLAIDEGATQADAGQQAGLTKGQVRYWLGKFRKDGTDIFPEELLSQTQPEEADSPQSSAEPIASPDTPDLEQADGEEEAQQDLLDTEETTGPVDEALAQQEDAPEAKKKPKKKSKKTKKTKKVKKPKQAKKKKKTKKSKKTTKKKKSKKAKGKSSKKAKKKSKK